MIENLEVRCDETIFWSQRQTEVSPVLYWFASRISGGGCPPHGRGGIVVNASESGFLIESVKNMPIGTKLNICVLFPKEFELTDFKVAAEVVWKEVHWKEDWEGYQYGLKFNRILREDHSKLKLILNGRYHLEKIPCYL